MHQNRLAIFAILLLALLLRIAWILHLPSDEASLSKLPDQVEYLSLGKNLLHNHQLALFDERFSQTIYAYRTPGYPALIALCGAKLTVIRFIQAILDTSTVLAIYLLAHRWLRPRACLFACALIAINPFLIYFTGLILSETLFIALLAWGMALLAIRKNFSLKLSGALLLAISVYVRPSALLLPALLIAAEALISGQRIRRIALPAIVGFVLTIILLIPWAMRNGQTIGAHIWTTTNSGITSYDGFNPQANGSSNQSFITTMPELRSMNEVDRDAYLSKFARQYALEHPARAIWLAIVKIGRTWSPIPLSDEYGSRRLYVVAAACWSIPLDLLIVWGLWRGRLSRAAKVYCLLPALYFTIVHAISVGSLRYRVPAEAILIVIGASGFGCRVSGVGKDKDRDTSTRTPNPDTRNPI